MRYWESENNTATTTTKFTMKLSAFVLLALFSLVHGLPPNYDDIEDSQEQSVNAVVDISQEEPNSNAIHIAHNIPTGSKITVKQTRKVCLFFVSI